MNLARSAAHPISRCETASPLEWAQRLRTGRRMNVMHRRGVVLALLLVGCGPIHGMTVTPHKPGTPGELKREKATEMAELDDMLCVRLDTGHVRCALLDSFDDY